MRRASGLGGTLMVAFAVLSGACQDKPPVNSKLLLDGEGVLLAPGPTTLYRRGGEPLVAVLPSVPAAGMLACPEPVELRVSGRGVAPGRAGITGIGTVRPVDGEQEIEGLRIFHYQWSCGARDLGPFPPVHKELTFDADAPFLTSRLELVALRGRELVRYDPQTGSVTPIPVPSELEGALLRTSRHTHWFDGVGSDGYVAQVGQELLHWNADGIIDRHPLPGDASFLVKGHSNQPRYAAISDRAGIVVDRFRSDVRVHDLAEGKTPPNGARLFFREGEWNPFGSSFAYWSSEVGGCRSNGYACNEVFDLMSYSAVQESTAVLLPHASSAVTPWAWVQDDVFRCRRPSLSSAMGR